MRRYYDMRDNRRKIEAVERWRACECLRAREHNRPPDPFSIFPRASLYYYISDPYGDFHLERESRFRKIFWLDIFRIFAYVCISNS